MSSHRPVKDDALEIGRQGFRNILSASVGIIFLNWRQVVFTVEYRYFQVPEFQQENYTENFVQCTLDGGLANNKKGAVLVVGGDGRFLCRETVNLIIQIAAANGVRFLALCH